MNIDIINYTAEQYAALNDEQILQIEKAQGAKDRLSRKLEEKKLSEKYRLSKSGVFHSKIWEKICASLDADFEAEVELIREGLLFYLQYSGKPSSSNPNVPYVVNYSLTIQERVSIVKVYYMEAYTDPNERFNAFKADKVAPGYLCEAYSSLYQWFYYDVV